MTKTITVKRITELEETIDIELPAYFTDGHNQFKVYEDAILQVGERFVFATVEGGMFYKSELDKVIKLNPSTDANFMNQYNACMSIINPLVNSAKCITQQA